MHLLQCWQPISVVEAVPFEGKEPIYICTDGAEEALLGVMYTKQQNTANENGTKKNDPYKNK